MTPSRSGKACSERGSVLLLVVVFVVILGGLTMGMLLESLADRTAVVHTETSHAALDVAETGVVRAEMEIRSLVDADGDGIGTLSGAYGQGTYEVTATPDAQNPDRYVIVSTGFVGHSRRRIEVTVRRRDNSRFAEGLYAKEQLDFGGSSQTDAYDSRLGTYDAQAVNTDAGGTYAQAGGDIGSGMDIVLHGSSSTVRGNAIPGPLHQTQLNGAATVWGDTMPRRAPVSVPDVPYAEFEAAFNTNNNQELLGTNALGLDAATDMTTVSDTELERLTRQQTLEIASYDTLRATDGTLDGLTYDDLFSDNYESLVKVAESTLLESSGTGLTTYKYADYDVVMLGDTSLGTDGMLSPTYDTTTQTTSGGGGGGSTDPAAGRPGRVSYDDSTKKLRATAGAAVVLNGGTYFFSHVKFVGRAHLVVRGPTKIYVSGSFDLGGGSIINESGKPEDLEIIVQPYALPYTHVPTPAYVDVRGGADIAAAIYAPAVPVRIGGGDHFYGSAVGRTIDVLGNVRFHYDMALRDVGGSDGAFIERLYWRELSIPAR